MSLDEQLDVELDNDEDDELDDDFRLFDFFTATDYYKFEKKNYYNIIVFLKKKSLKYFKI